MVAITKPTINGSSNTWGSELNTALDTLAGAVTTLETGTATTPVPLSTLTTKGDILAATGPAAVARVHAATDGLVLTSSNAATAGVTFTYPPGTLVAKLRQTITQTLSAGFNSITLQTADYIRTGFGTFTAGTTYTPGVAGWYELTGGVTFTGAAGGSRLTCWQISGTQLTHSAQTALGLGGGLPDSLTARTMQVQLSATDTITLVGYFVGLSSGTTLSTYTTSPYGSYLGIRYLGA